MKLATDAVALVWPRS